MKHAVTILGVATLLAGVTPAVYAQPTQPLLIQGQTYELSQQGESKLRSGDYQGALKAYNQVLQLNPNDDTAYVNRGTARFELGDKHGAMDDFTQAVELNPKNAEAYRQRGGLYLIMGNKKKSRQDFQQLAKLSRNQGGEANSQPGGQTNSQPTQNPLRQLQH